MKAEVTADLVHVAKTLLHGSDRAPSRLDRAMQQYATDGAIKFGEFYEALRPQLHRFCIRLTRQRSDADDLFQDALLRLHCARASYMFDAPALPWAKKIVHSAYVDRVRRRRRHPEDLHEADGAPGERLPMKSNSSPESDACARALLVLVDQVIARMSEKNRRAYILLQKEELSVPEAAAVLGTTCDAVKQRAHRAYHQIRQALRKAGWDRGMP